MCSYGTGVLPYGFASKALPPAMLAWAQRVLPARRVPGPAAAAVLLWGGCVWQSLNLNSVELRVGIAAVVLVEAVIGRS